MGLGKAQRLDLVVAARKRAEAVARTAKVFIWIASIIGVGLAIRASPWWSWLLMVPLVFGATIAITAFIDGLAKAHWINLGLRLEQTDQ